MTYLNLVNSVLRRLREEEVSSVQSSTYSKMAGDFVNDAKRIVEDSWDWSALRLVCTSDTACEDILRKHKRVEMSRCGVRSGARI